MKIEQFHNKNQFLITDNEKIYVEFRDKKNV